MPQSSTKGTPDRLKTDKNLETERRNADQVLAEQKTAVEAAADQVVDRAREHADAILHEARDKADEKLESVRPSPVIRAVIDEERQHEDRAVEHERAKADESLQREREQNARDLLALLPHERKSTDQSLHTERVRSDDAVAHRDDVLGIVSHDLRDLLGGIVTTAAMLLRTAPLGEAGAPARTGAELIQRHATRMKRLIDDLTDVTSIDAGKLAVAPKPGNLAPLVSEAVISLRGAATAKNISLALPQPEIAMRAIFDADRVLQVLINLIANAIKFTPAGGQIRVACEHIDDTMRVSVADTGPGIAPEFLEAIFERYRQAGVADRRGLGLGLYIARKIIEAHHGKIWAQSSLGKGTTVTFTLPSPRQ